MHIQYASLVLDDNVNSTTKKKSQGTKRLSQKLADGKSFQKVKVCLVKIRLRNSVFLATRSIRFDHSTKRTSAKLL